MRPPAHILAAIAGLFGVSLGDLTGDAERTSPGSAMLGIVREQGREIARLKATIVAARNALSGAGESA